MINGFVVDIINNTNEQKEICLFKEGGIPEDVLVHVINNPALDLNYLLNIARTKGFMGSGLQVDTDLIDHLIIHDEENVETIGFKRILHPKEIKLNGVSKYICLSIPPQVPVLVQLLPVL